MDFMETLRAEIAKARAVMSEARSRHNLLKQTLRKYQQLQERRSADLALPARPRRRRAKKASRQTRRGAAPNKTGLIRDLIVEHHTSGISTDDLFVGLKRKRIDISKNAVFAALSKLKQRGFVTVRNDKSFPTESMLQAEQLRKPS
jgi:hypothetical protein